jgi:ATP-dependent RNA helicase DeaD
VQRRAGDMENGVWFKITVGRERNADPKWLLPEICRQGEITKKDIGAIRVYERETRFEVSPDVADSFAAHVAARKKGGVRIFAAPDGPNVDTAPDSAVAAPPGEPAGKPPFAKNKNKHFAGNRKHTTAKRRGPDS